MSFATNQNATAQRLITKYGNTMTLKSVTKGTYDPATGTTGADTIIETPIKGTFEQFSSDEIKGDILQGDIKVLVALDFVPDTKSKLVFNSVSYSIIDISPTIAQDTTIMYQLQVRI